MNSKQEGGIIGMSWGIKDNYSNDNSILYNFHIPKHMKDKVSSKITKFKSPKHMHKGKN